MSDGAYCHYCQKYTCECRTSDDAAKAAERKCEGCGVSGMVERLAINTPNGRLTLCRQCLAAVNEKNPELASLRAALADARRDRERLAAAVGAAVRAIENYKEPPVIRVGPHPLKSVLDVLRAALANGSGGGG